MQSYIILVNDSLRSFFTYIQDLKMLIMNLNLRHSMLQLEVFRPSTQIGRYFYCLLMISLVTDNHHIDRYLSIRDFGIACNYDLFQITINTINYNRQQLIFNNIHVIKLLFVPYVNCMFECPIQTLTYAACDLLPSFSGGKMA